LLKDSKFAFRDAFVDVKFMFNRLLLIKNDIYFDVYSSRP
jgi:hypothetical protein